MKTRCSTKHSIYVKNLNKAAVRACVRASKDKNNDQKMSLCIILSEKVAKFENTEDSY